MKARSNGEVKQEGKFGTFWQGGEHEQDYSGLTFPGSPRLPEQPHPSASRRPILAARTPRPPWDCPVVCPDALQARASCTPAGHDNM